MSDFVRQRVSRFARSSATIKPRTDLCVSTANFGRVALSSTAWASFKQWFDDDACASERKVASHPAMVRSLRLALRVRREDAFWALLCFWRIDNMSVWDSIESDVLNRKWAAVVLQLRKCHQVDGRMQAGTHRIYVSSHLKGALGPEQHIAFMRQWYNACKALTHQTFTDAPSIASSVAAVLMPAPAGGSSGGLCTSGVAVVSSMLHGMGPYASKNVENSLRLAGHARHNVGTVGPGSYQAAMMLLGKTIEGTSRGLWPWQEDPRNARAVVMEVARRTNISWCDAQQALCYWLKTRPMRR